MATASHAEPIDDLLETLRTVSGPRDMTALIGPKPPPMTYEACNRILTEPVVSVTWLVYRACLEAEAAKAWQRAKDHFDD